ncbi:XdhC family protein [Nesterenkonia salmonea]|uniref:XdhC family protein n=1 Tax=Nesterenkonia salmonea TaxID=1804987 RepID=UPI00140E25A5|nr:XdhC/CoxI family protein [Nesterenkonia salmonea]
MLDRITEYQSCLDQPERWAVATVVAVAGSTPVPVGTSMAVSADLEVMGSLSGGCVESATASLAQQSIAEGTPRVESFGPDGDLLGEIPLTCGGQIRVLIQPLASMPELQHARMLSGADPHHAVDFTRTIVLGGETMTVVEHREAAPRLLLFGVQDYSLHCAQLALGAGWRVQLIDHRPAFATPQRVPEGAQLTVDHPADTAADLLSDPRQSWTAACVMTHLPELDVPVLDTLLRAEPGPDFIGALGSHNAQRRRRSALAQRGHSASALGKIHGPLGLDIAAASPAESAVSIFAELISAKNSAPSSRQSRSLSTTAGPINYSRTRSASIMHPARIGAGSARRVTDLAVSS